MGALTGKKIGVSRKFNVDCDYQRSGRVLFGKMWRMETMTTWEPELVV
jgi:hypothetical protein